MSRPLLTWADVVTEAARQEAEGAPYVLVVEGPSAGEQDDCS